jgi:hypothetical protein
MPSTNSTISHLILAPIRAAQLNFLLGAMLRADTSDLCIATAMGNRAALDFRAVLGA